MELRPGRPSDAAAIGDYHHRCWLQGYRGLVAQQIIDDLDVGERIALWEKQLADPPEHLLVATIDDVPIAHVLVDEDTVQNVYVDPNHWRHGIGRALLREGEAMVRAQGFVTAYLWTIIGNERAIALYESEGWVQDGTTEWHRSATGDLIEELRMQKQLGVA